MNLSDKTINHLKQLAQRSAMIDDEESFDASDGGNFDDTYYRGMDDGETVLARDLLDELGIEWKK